MAGGETSTRTPPHHPTCASLRHRPDGRQDAAHGRRGEDGTGHHAGQHALPDVPYGTRRGVGGCSGGQPARGSGGGELTCVGRLMAGAPPGKQSDPTPDGYQVGSQDYPVSLQEPEAGVTGHQPGQRVVGAVRHRVYQLLGDLAAQRGGSGGGTGMVWGWGGLWGSRGLPATPWLTSMWAARWG